MNKIQCEHKILLKLAEIGEIYHKYNPDGKYLSMAIVDGHMDVTNSYNGADKEHQINAWCDPSKDNEVASWSDGHSHGKMVLFDLITGKIIDPKKAAQP